MAIVTAYLRFLWANRVRLAWLAAVLLAIDVTVYYFTSPYRLLPVVEKALRTGEGGELAGYIDFPALRASLKAEFRARLGAGGAEAAAMSDYNDIMGGGLDAAIDRAVTPMGLNLALDAGRDGLIRAVQNGAAARGEANPVYSFRPEHAGFASLTDFVFDLSGNKVHLRFAGLRWKICRIELTNFALARVDGQPRPAAVVAAIF